MGALFLMSEVPLQVECNVTDVGDRVCLSGDIEEFGAWNSLAAIPMTTTDETFPVTLPPYAPTVLQ